MKSISSTILKGKYLQKLMMTTQTSNKKIIVELTNHMKQIAENNGTASLSSSQLGGLHSVFVIVERHLLRSQKFLNYKCKASQYQSYINPKILDFSVNQIDSWEECASYPNLKFLIKRSTHIIVEYEKTFRDRLSVKQEWKGFQALVFQHEYSHLRCNNLFDISEQVDLIQNKQYSQQKSKKLKEQFEKFKRQRDLQNNQLKKLKQQDELDLYSYKNCKDLKNFVEYQILDPM